MRLYNHFYLFTFFRADVVLYHKPRGSNGNWIPLANQSELRVSPEHGKKLRVLVSGLQTSLISTEKVVNSFFVVKENMIASDISIQVEVFLTITRFFITL